MEQEIRPYFSLYITIQKVLDFFFLSSALISLNYLYNGGWNLTYFIAGMASGAVFVFLAQFHGVYEGWRGYSIINEVSKVLKSWTYTWFIIVAAIFAIKTSSYFSRFIIFSWGLLVPTVLISYKLVMRSLVAKVRLKEGRWKRIAIGGAGALGKKLGQTFCDNEWLGCKVFAFYDDNPELANSSQIGIEVKGTLDDMVEDAKSGNYDDVYLTLPLRAEKRIKEVIKYLSNSSTCVKIVPDFFSFDLLRSKWTDLGGIPVISVYDSPLDGLGTLVKRIEDIILSLIILTAVSPIMLLIYIGVKISSPGPFLFKQKRYGAKGNEIIVWKIRSMTVCENGNSVNQAVKNDRRVTKIGGFLRKTSLDELPQFLNVLSGSMSVVGPRPHASTHNEYYRVKIPGYMQRHLMKPGITGWAQVNGWRGETDTIDKMEKRIQYDLDYLKRWSVWFDIKIVVLTIFKGFINKNAY